jgi:hypothetical protein
MMKLVMPWDISNDFVCYIVINKESDIRGGFKRYFLDYKIESLINYSYVR